MDNALNPNYKGRHPNFNLAKVFEDSISKEFQLSFITCVNRIKTRISSFIKSLLQTLKDTILRKLNLFDENDRKITSYIDTHIARETKSCFENRINKAFFDTKDPQAITAKLMQQIFTDQFGEIFKKCIDKESLYVKKIERRTLTVSTRDGINKLIANKSHIIKNLCKAIVLQAVMQLIRIVHSKTEKMKKHIAEYDERSTVKNLFLFGQEFRNCIKQVAEYSRLGESTTDSKTKEYLAYLIDSISKMQALLNESPKGNHDNSNLIGKEISDSKRHKLLLKRLVTIKFPRLSHFAYMNSCKYRISMLYSEETFEII